ncbi:EEIG1/EHBP1 N-terminal domain-containing protein [Tanacetum coccineum]
MVVNMMKWVPWPPLSSSKFQAKITIHHVQDLSKSGQDCSSLSVEVKWKGSSNRISFKRGSVKRDMTKGGLVTDDGVVVWNEEFDNVCDLLKVGVNDGGFCQWDVGFKVFNGSNQGPKRRDHVVATGSLNLAEFAYGEQEKTPINVHLSVPGTTDCHPVLSISLSLLELRTEHDSKQLEQRFVTPLVGDEPLGLKAGFKKVKIFRAFSPNRAKKAYSEEGSSDGKSSVRSREKMPKRSIFPLRKRKLSFRSFKAKGEPLLKRDIREEGGDDIDFDRRMLTSSDESSYGWHRSDEGSTTSRSSISEFGDDNFVVGESSCTSLSLPTIATWFQNNHNQMPLKSELDTLVREGSSEWRDLCKNEVYKKRFPDKHFDLETVLEAKTRNLEVVPEKSFVGFFQLEDGVFDFLDGAMSFDNIWDEISQNGSNSNHVYIVSWNDHFFILKVERDAYYIIDTLGERLYEGCNQAYVLKFDKDTKIQNLPVDSQKSNAKAEHSLVSKGKESCKEYIKSFIAAIPLRELQADVKKGLMAASSQLVHHRLQIEFHYTKCLAVNTNMSTIVV